MRGELGYGELRAITVFDFVLLSTGVIRGDDELVALKYLVLFKF